METVLFVPGFDEILESRNYVGLMKAIEGRGYRVKFVPIEWRRTSIKGWERQLGKYYADHNPKKTILAGFSLGAMTVFTAAAKRNPEALWLFSLSPYFAEDISQQNKEALAEIGKRRIEAFTRIHFTEYAKRISCKTLSFAGSEEIVRSPLLDRRCKAVSEHIVHSRSIIVPGVGHDVTHKNYIANIKAVI